MPGVWNQRPIPSRGPSWWRKAKSLEASVKPRRDSSSSNERGGRRTNEREGHDAGGQHPDTIQRLLKFLHSLVVFLADRERAIFQALLLEAQMRSTAKFLPMVPLLFTAMQVRD